MGTRKDHAEHNEKLSQLLYDEKVFFDWANTTAFYAALHFVNDKLLPAKYNGIECSRIADAAKALNCKSKHEATMEMVNIQMPVIANDYKFLMDCSFTARYNDYQVAPGHAKICQKKLKIIKDHCFPTV